jgi:hypothetical protein
MPDARVAKPPTKKGLPTSSAPKKHVMLDVKVENLQEMNVNT